MPLRRALHLLAAARPRGTSAAPTAAARHFGSAARLHRAQPALSLVEVPVGGKPARLHAIWLRDHCKCPECWHPVTRQRLVETHTIPRDLAPTAVAHEGGAVRVTWADGHVSTYPDAWLADHAYGDAPRYRAHLEPQPKRVTWGSEVAANPPAVEYADVMGSDAGLRDWLTNIAAYGFSFVRNVPASVPETKALAERIAFIRETHYGTFWDFSPNLEHGDTAYTQIALPAHTDTTYFSDPIGLQMFHLLQFSGKGGESLMVDGLAVAKQLYAESPEAYKALTEIPVAAHCAGDEGTYIYPHPRHRPMFTEDPTLGSGPDALVTVRYNNNDRSVLNHLSASDVERFYDALLRWQRLVHDTPANEYWYAMQPGTVVIVDNHRVMHGRAAFTGTDRRLTGCYINGDDWRSRLRAVSGDGGRRLC